jgi:hemerythrin superfamily protein
MTDTTQDTAANTATFKPVPNAIGMLMADHLSVAVLFDSFENARASGDGTLKRALAIQIATELTVHATIEEEIFYPAVRELRPDAGDLVDEAESEHAEVKAAIAELAGMLDSTPDSAKVDALMGRIMEGVRHHVEEEETQMFPKLRLADADLTDTGLAMKARKEDLKTTLAETAGKRFAL